MKLKYFYHLMIFCTYLSVVACGKKDSVSSERGDIDVKIPVNAVRAEGADDNSPAFTFQVVKLLDIFSLNKVRGKYARFFLNPRVEKNRLNGVFPEANFFKNKDNVYIPEDDISSEMASIYYHVQNMALFDKKLGVGDVNKLPRDIGLDVKYKSSAASNSYEKDNVLYEGNYDAILFAPNENEKLPLAINGGIIAHEHFHSLFHKIVMSKLYAENILPKEIRLTTHYVDDEEKKDLMREITEHLAKRFDIAENELRTAYNLVLLKGLNEGLADFWGWLYTNDDNFIVHSLPGVGSNRSLKIKADDLQNLSIPSRSQIVAMLKIYAQQSDLFEANLNAYSYDLGTQFARALKAFAEKRKKSQSKSLSQAKDEIAKSVVLFLSNITDEFKSKAKQEMVDPNSLALRLMTGVENLSQDECEAVVRVLTRSKDSGQDRKCKTKNGKVVVE